MPRSAISALVSIAASVVAGADANRSVLPLDAPELVEAADVDEVLERREPQRQHRHEALAAGEDLGLVAELAQQPDGLGHGRGSVVVELGRLHRATV